MFGALWEDEVKCRPSQRSRVITVVSDAIAAGVRQERACGAVFLSMRTLEHWQRVQSRGDAPPALVKLNGKSIQCGLAVANWHRPFLAEVALCQIVVAAQADELVGGRLLPGDVEPAHN